MAAETIREFLVAIGFKVDQPTLKKFEDAITGATFKANVLADAFLGMVKGIANHVREATKELEDLYYTSVRVGSSATNLKALGQAAQDFGVSTEEALSNIDELAKALQTDPGKEGFINSLGVRTREANGNLRDTVDIANDLGQALAQRPDYMSQRLAEVVGLTYKFRKAIEDPGWIDDFGKHIRLLGPDWEDAAKKSAQLKQQWRELEDQWDSLKTRFDIGLFGALIPEFEKVDKYLEAHAPQISAFIGGIATAIERVIKAIDILSGKVNFTKFLGLGEYHKENEFQKYQREHIQGPVNRWTDSVADWFLGKIGISRKDLAEAWKMDAPTSTPGSAIGIRDNNPGNLMYAGQAGAIRSGGGPQGQTRAAFRTPAEGLLAMAKQLELYAKRGADTIGALVTDYEGHDYKNNDIPAYIQDVVRQMHVAGSGARLNMNDPAVVTSLMNAMIMHENMANPYRPELVRGAADAAVRAGTTTITQNNTLNIDGSKDVTATKRAVNEALTDSFRKATRNLQPTAQ